MLGACVVSNAFLNCTHILAHMIMKLNDYVLDRIFHVGIGRLLVNSWTVILLTSKDEMLPQATGSSVS